MSLQLIFGNSGAGKSHDLFEHIIEESIKYPDKNFIVLVPEQFTLQTQKELVMRHPGHGIMNIDVLSFARLAFRVMEELGENDKIVLDDEGKNLIIRKIAGQEENKLKVLKGNLKKNGYITEMKSVISELTQYDISPEDMDSMIKAAGESTYLSWKLKDIQQVYSAFEQYLEDKYITTEEVLDILSKTVTRSKILKNSVVALDGYTGFTPLQNKVLAKMMRHCEKVLVTVTMDEREDPYVLEDKFRLFAMSKQMTRSLLKVAEQEGVTVEDPVELYEKPVYRFRENEDLGYLEKELFRTKSVPYDKKPSAIRIYRSANPSEEVECAAQRIRSLVRNSGYRYRQIAVITSDMGTYENEIQKIFHTYHIPVFMDYKRSVLQNPFVEYVRSLLVMADKNLTQESVFRFLRTGLAGFTSDEIDLLENYVLSKGIKGYKKWQSGWIRRSKYDTEDILEKVNSLRVRLVEKIDPLMQVLKQKKKTVREITLALYEFLVAENIQQKLKDQEDFFLEEGESALAKEYAQIYRVMMDLFDKFVGLLGDENVALKEYCELLDAGMEEARVGVIPPGIDEVVAGDLERTRLKDIKALIFLGLNDTLLPGNMTGGGLLSERDRERFEQSGIELAPGSKEKMFIQKFYLYLQMTKPTEHLDLMFSRVSEDGKTIRPAYIITEILRLFPQVKVFDMDEYPAEVKELVPEKGLEYIAEALRRPEKFDQGTRQELFRWYVHSPEYQEILEKMIRSSEYRRPDDELTRKTAQKIYGEMEPSISRMEKYVSCACAHFLRYGLRLNEREEYEFAPMDFGNVFHSALEKYAKKLEQMGMSWIDITEEDQEKLVDEVVDESVSEYSNTVLYSSARNSYMIPRMKRMMKRTVWAMKYQLGQGSFKPEGYEVPFKSGKIDRIDTCVTDDKVYVKIIDYKTGQKSFDMAAFYHGLSMQLVIYMGEALKLEERKYPDKKVVPAGIFYYKMKDPVVDKIIDHDKLETAILKELRLDGIVNDDEVVIQSLDKEFTGASTVIPVSRTKSGYSKTSKVLSEEQFESVIEYAKFKRKELLEEMKSGNVLAEPFKMGTQTGCDYCPYHEICGFDEQIEGFEYRQLPSMDKEEVLAKIADENEKRKGEV